MQGTLSIGDFSRASNMSVKTLRYYHRVDLLVPADIDPHTGYRRYGVDQIPTAQIIRRFRALDMPVEEVYAVLATPDVTKRNDLTPPISTASRKVRPLGRVTPAVIPALEVAVIEHPGTHADIDRAYGALATYVSRHALAVDGPLREYYPVSHLDTPDESRWITEIGWPIFNTTA
jgi:DNA-binding transcriptional MerR regulator